MPSLLIQKTAMGNNACLIDDVTFRYFEKSERNILEHFSLSIKEGETVVILGDSGCGKSTLANLICGLYPENGGFLINGSVKVDGIEIKNLPPRKRREKISIVFQNPDLQFCMSNLRDELRFCLENAAVEAKEMDRRIEAFAAAYSISSLLDRPFQTLSGGEKQKASLCVAMIQESKVLVLDEPFANLDTASRDPFLDLLKQERLKNPETTIIAIDHRAGNWTGLSPRWVVLGDKGKIISDGTSFPHLKTYSAYFTPAPAPSLSDAEPFLKFRGTLIKPGKKEKAILEATDLSVKPGDMIALLGPSGSGKTTLFLTLLGIKPYEGSIMIDDKELRKQKKKDIYRDIGIVFQNPANQFIASTVLDEAKPADIELLASFGLANYSRYSPYMLSQGQQRKLGVISMIAGKQRLLLLDEPTYGQDTPSTAAIMKCLAERTGKGLSVIFSTHDEELASLYANKIWRIRNGRIYETDKSIG